MESEYYKEYYHIEREHWWFRAREAILDAQVKKLIHNKEISEKTILNLGAAAGRTSEWLAKYGKVTSLEYDPDCCAMTRKLTGLEIVEGSVLALPFPDQSFDLVTAFDVIEHVEEAEKGL